MPDFVFDHPANVRPLVVAVSCPRRVRDRERVFDLLARTPEAESYAAGAGHGLYVIDADLHCNDAA